MKICFILGSANISGGTAVVFEHALYLQRAGHSVALVTLLPLTEVRVPWHAALSELSFLTLEDAAQREFDVAIATWWKTVAALPRIQARHFLYFVQSIESRFYGHGAEALRDCADSTYKLPLPIITEAAWIMDHLTTRFGRDCVLVRNGCNKKIFNADGPFVAPRQKGRLRVLIEGPLGVDFKNVARSVALARRSDANEIWLLTSSRIRYYPGVDRVFSRVSMGDCAAIYRSCDVLVKLSFIEGMFGPPLEMFHCGGTAIVYAVTGHEEYVRHGENALVIPADREDAVIDAISSLKKDGALLANLCEGARETAGRWHDWPEASALFEDALTHLTQHAAPHQEQLRDCLTQWGAQYHSVLNADASANGKAGSFVSRLRRLVDHVEAPVLDQIRGFFQGWRLRLYEERCRYKPLHWGD